MHFWFPKTGGSGDMISSVAQWLAEYEAVFSAMAALVALAGVSYGVTRLVLSPIMARRANADTMQTGALLPSTGLSSPHDNTAQVAGTKPPPHQFDLQDDHVSVAILGFEALSSNEDDKYIAAGIASEIIALITPVSDLRVSARATIYDWQAEAVPARQAAAQINAKFALTGSLRIQGKRMRVIANLTELNSDAHVWTGTFNKEIDDLFEVQYDIAHSIVGAILGEVRLTESQLADKLPVHQLDSWGLLQKAYYFWLSNFSVENVLKAIDYLRKAIAIDPDYVAPKAALAMLLSQLTTSRVCEDHEAALAEIAALADQAYQLAPNDANVLESLGVAWQNIGDGKRAEKAFRRALELTPLNLICRGYLAMTRAFVGGAPGAAEAKRILTENFTIAPQHPSGPWWHWFLAIAEQSQGHYQASREHCEKSLMAQQGWVHTYYFLANALCELGELHEAQLQLEVAGKLNPLYNLDVYVDNLRLIAGSDELAKQFYSGFAKAGLLQQAV
jgi:adenylate cyclase